MTNQLQGEILFAGWAGSADPQATDWAYTPWMPVRGDLGTFAVQVLVISGLTLGWEVQTRTAEDPASIVTLVTPAGITSVGTAYAANSSTKAKQFVRYRFKTGATASLSDYVIFRALPPSWQVNR
mgnify:CR=1 FL=1